jgi:diguanylate cyclase (GGDEF)-like protein
LTSDLAQQGVAPLLYGAAGAFLATLYWKRRAARTKPPSEAPPLAQRANDRAQLEELFERCRTAEEKARISQHALIQIPEVAQRLLGARTLREIPEIALDLIEELLLPRFAVFYRIQRGEFVAAARRGESEFELGHRLKKGEGVVGWTALRQLPFTPDDAAHESRSVRERDLAIAMPREGFTVCLPIVSGEETVAVILVGPTTQAIAKPTEAGRIVALLTAVAIKSVEIFQRQQYLAQTDGLTGLLNKRTILEYLGSRLTKNHDDPLSVFLFDIDYFKTFNDTNGHLAGDDLLKAMGALIRDHCRDGEGLGRYGGEEFVLVLADSKAHSLAAAERLRGLVASTDFPGRMSQPGGQITISGGVASYPSDGTDVASLLRAADEALYQAKRAGRNRVVPYSVPDLTDGEEEGIELVEEKPQ